jgi:hypothetical protein
MEREPSPGRVGVPEPREGIVHPMAKHFEQLRGARREHRAGAGHTSSGSRKRRAALTMVRNEPVFFPIWLRYYSRFFDRRFDGARRICPHSSQP